MPVVSISHLHCLLPRFFASIRYIVFIRISIYSIVQRVGAVEVLVAIVRQLGAKLTSTDRGQASGVCSLTVDLHQWQFILLSDQMARTKNVGGGSGDDDRRPLPRQPAGSKGKASKRVTSKKCKYPDAKTVRAAAVAEAAERAERGGARSGVVIVDHLAPDAQGRLE